MDLLYTHPGFTRITEQIETPIREKLLASALSKFVLLNSQSLSVLVIDACYIHSRRALLEHFKSINTDNAALHGFLGDAAVFSLTTGADHPGFTPFHSLPYADIDRVSQCVFAGFTTQKFLKTTKFCSFCGQKLALFGTLKTTKYCEDCEIEVEMNQKVEVFAAKMHGKNIGKQVERGDLLCGETVQQCAVRVLGLQRHEVDEVLLLNDNTPSCENGVKQIFFLIVKVKQEFGECMEVEEWRESVERKPMEQFVEYIKALK